MRATQFIKGVAEGSLNEGQYEMMMRNGQVKKFIAKDDADAKRIAAGHGAKSVIKLRGGVPAGKVSEQGVAEGYQSSKTTEQIKFWYKDAADAEEMAKAAEALNVNGMYDEAIKKYKHQAQISLSKANSLKQGVAEGNQEEKIGGRYDADEFDSMVSRLKKLAGAGPMRTVYDPDRRVYRNMPTAQQPAQQPKKASR